MQKGTKNSKDLDERPHGSEHGIARREYLKKSLIGLTAVLLTESVVSQYVQLAASTLVVRRRYPGPSYTVFIDSADNLVKAQNNTTGAIDYSGTDAATVIMQACIPNSTVLIKAGTYIISQQYGIIINKKSGVELYGEGQDKTILKLANNMNDKVLVITESDNVSVHDLQIDGNRINQNQGTGSPAINGHGIVAWRATGLTIENVYIHDARCFGIDLSECTNCQVLNSRVENSDANGITIDNEAGGSGIVVRGNTVDGASDVGITSWDGNGFLAESNTVRNVMMNSSSFGWNSHVGMMVENGPSTGVTYKNNDVGNCGDGLAANGGTNLLFDSNTVHDCLRGLMIAGTAGGISGVTIRNCIFDGIGNSPQPSYMGGAARVDPDGKPGPISITGCQLNNIGPYIQDGAVAQLWSPAGTLSGNTLHTSDGKYTAIDAQTGWTIQNNTILP